MCISEVIDVSPSNLDSNCASSSPAFHMIYSVYTEKALATHSSVLAWRILGTGEPGGLLSMGLHRVRHD